MHRSAQILPLHGLRHVFASTLASSGKVDMYTLQKLLTHKSPIMTQRYAHLRDDALKRASEQFPAQHLWKRIGSFTRQRLERMAKAAFDSNAIHKGRSKGPIKSAINFFI